MNGFSRDSVNLKAEFFRIFSTSEQTAGVATSGSPRFTRRGCRCDAFEAAEDGLADDFAFGLHRAGNGRVIIQRHVCAGDVAIVVDVIRQHQAPEYQVETGRLDIHS